jgi:hypothetical protein
MSEKDFLLHCSMVLEGGKWFVFHHFKNWMTARHPRKSVCTYAKVTYCLLSILIVFRRVLLGLGQDGTDALSDFHLVTKIATAQGTNGITVGNGD